MWWIWLAGCASWGPRAALEDVDSALDRGDRAAFERLVDADAVVPAMTATCARLALRQDLEAAQFRPAGPFTGGGTAPGDQAIASWLQSADERQGAVDAFWASFPVLPVAQCPALDFDAGEAKLSRVDADHWTAEAGGGWLLDVARVDGAWRVVGAHGEPLVAAREAEAMATAAARAEDLSHALRAGAPNDTWESLRNYVDNHPEATRIADRLAKALAPLEGAPPVVPTTQTGFYLPNGLIPVRHVDTVVALDAPVEAVTVRFTFFDAAGAPVTSGGGARALVVRSGPSPAGVLHVATRAGGMSWPTAASAVATVAEIRYADGRVVQHPAVVAGAWSAAPNSEPHQGG